MSDFPSHKVLIAAFEFDENTLIHHVHSIVSNLPISENRLQQFKAETEKDPVLKTLIKYTTHGWPEKHSVPPEIMPFYTYRNEITFFEGFSKQFWGWICFIIFEVSTRILSTVLATFIV